jgi:hypothetical protein
MKLVKGRPEKKARLLERINSALDQDSPDRFRDPGFRA